MLILSLISVTVNILYMTPMFLFSAPARNRRTLVDIIVGSAGKQRQQAEYRPSGRSRILGYALPKKWRELAILPGGMFLIRHHS